MNDVSKAAVTVAEMARMVGLSRARFYQLQQAGTFPLPIYDLTTRRPLYNEELQRICLDVRKRNCGIDGKPVLFYARCRALMPSRPKKASKAEPKGKNIPALLDGLNSLGLTTATAAQIEAVTRELFPNGTDGADQGEVLRAVFLHIRRQYSADNVQR